MIADTKEVKFSKTNPFLWSQAVHHAAWIKPILSLTLFTPKSLCTKPTLVKLHPSPCSIFLPAKLLPTYKVLTKHNFVNVPLAPYILPLITKKSLTFALDYILRNH